MYSYENERNKIFSEEGQREFIKIRDHVKKLLSVAGAFSMARGFEPITGSSWLKMAYIDRMVELGEIREITKCVAGQDRVFVSI